MRPYPNIARRDRRRVPARRRASALVALAAPLAVVAVVAGALLDRPLPLLLAVTGIVAAIAAAAYALTRTGIRRAIATAAALLALIAPVVLISRDGRETWLIPVAALLAIETAATRHALGRDRAALRSEPTPGDPVGAARHPVLIVNPASGDGKAERANLAEEARRQGIEAVVLAPGDDLLELARRAVAAGADVIGMAGGDGSQGLVASVAAAHDVAYVCVPAGTRNHLAMDLGLDRDDVAGALDAFGPAVERRIDLGLIGDRVFVNNASIGLYAKIVQSPEYRENKVRTSLELLPSMLGPDAVPFDLRFEEPDGSEHRSAHLILVCNGQYSWRGGEGFGSRRQIDDGVLSIVAATLRSPVDVARFARAGTSVAGRRPSGWIEWSAEEFELDSGAPIEVGIDGESALVDPPIRFAISSGALRVRIPRDAPGYSPAAAVPTRGWSTLTALLQVAAGRPVAIDG